MAGVPLAAAISELRRQITAAVAQPQGEDLRFKLGPIELELQIEIEDSVNAEAGVNVWVVSVGAGGTSRSTHTHRVTLSLQPHTAQGGDIVVSRRTSGQPAPMSE